ncbi:MAG: N-acetylmuramoyl-L-alanine amidase [Sulfitobacter sp.]|nr:N-acetylmuramoyl-L-alanine amidase [Sulfitobacter sp.]
MQIEDHPSPNQGPRRDGLRPHLVVLHHTAMHSAEAACARLCDPQFEVSSHYLISNRGRIQRLVPEDQRAWHAGAGAWQGLEDINSRSIGIELDNAGDHPFSEPLMAALDFLLADILHRHGIPPQGVIGHSDMAPGRKQDPGPRFDWARLARQGLAAPLAVTEPDEITPDAFLRAAHAAGYSVDAPFETLLATTRLRSAPWRTGPLGHADFTFPQA